MTPLLRRMTEDMLVRNLSPATQDNYIRAVSRFASHFDCSPGLLGPAEIRAYQVFLATEKHLHPNSINVEVCALRFLYGTTLQQECGLRSHPAAPQTAHEPAGRPQPRGSRATARLRAAHPAQYRAAACQPIRASH